MGGVFGSDMHFLTFLIILLEMVFFCYQIVHYLSRPSDKNRLYYLILLFLLLEQNVTGGLLPDKNIQINIAVQYVIAFVACIVMAMYFPFYFYKVYKLDKLKFYAYGGSVLFILVPFILLFLVPYILTKDIVLSRRLVVIVPFFYAISFIYSLASAIKVQAKENPNATSKKDVIGMYIAVIFWCTLPIIAFFEYNINDILEPYIHFHNGSQLVEVIFTNSGLFVMTALFIRQGIKQSRSEYDNLLKSEKELQELSAGLSIKVQERTRELELANEQRTNTFINLAHETKTPLTLINNYLEEYILKHGETEELNIVKFNIEKLSKDIVNFFDIERIRKGLDIYDNNITSNFSTILHDNLILFKQYSSKRNIEIVESIEDGVLIKADPEALCRIINNLIENSIKYTNLNGKIEICLKTNKENIIFSVKDNGIGIPKDQHNNIFEPYFQINSEKKNVQGMGMGLSIVKKIADKLNGSISLVSEPEGVAGTEISVHLRLHKGPITQASSEIERAVLTPHLYMGALDVIAEKNHDENKPAVLLVEDNIFLLRFLVDKLSAKYNVHFAASGSEALEKLKTITQLDIIVSDVMMDNGDGFYFYDGVVKQKRLKHIPFIFLTARTNIEDKLKGLALGAVDYMPKPFLIMELISKIDSVLNNLAEQREVLIHSTYRSLLQQNGGESIAHSNQNQFDVNCDKFNLTVREKEIVRLISKGQTYKEIANTLHISDKTVGKHIQNMFEKVDASNKAELVNKLGLSAIA